MNKNNRWAGIDRGEFIKVSATAMAGATSLTQSGEARAEERPYEIVWDQKSVCVKGITLSALAGPVCL